MSLTGAGGVPALARLARFGDRWRSRFRALRPVEKLYVVGLAAIGGSIAVSLCINDSSMISTLAWVGASALCFAFAQECYARSREWLSSLLFRWLMVPLGAMVGAFSVGSASSVVSSATGQDPSSFKLAVAFMAPVAAIPALAFLVSILAAIGMLGMFLAWGSQLSSRDRTKSSRAWIWIARAGGAFAALCLASPVVEADSSFHSMQKRWAGWMAQGLDMYVDTSCATGQWDRVRRLNDDLVIVARRTAQGLTFRRQACPLQPN